MTIRVLVGDCRAVLASLPAQSVHVAVTSPPYFALRDYETTPQAWTDGWVGELGQEPTIAAYVAHLLEVFTAVRRVLRDDGTLWVNIGDGHTPDHAQTRSPESPWARNAGALDRDVARVRDRRGPTDGLKPGDLRLVPARFALAMQAGGWRLRSEITLVKRSAKPQYLPGTRIAVDASTGDRVQKWGEGRPATACERFYLFAGPRRYYFDPEALRAAGYPVWDYVPLPRPPLGRHPAAYPRLIPRLAILAGTSEAGVCPVCRAPWLRATERVGGKDRDSITVHTRGWAPSCRCVTGQSAAPATVLDPFVGSGTTLVEANALGRHGVGIELHPDSATLTRQRLAGQPLSLFAYDGDSSGSSVHEG